MENISIRITTNHITLRLYLIRKLPEDLIFRQTFFYSTGHPFTAPLTYYYFNHALRVFYTERNSVRMADYIRLDLAANINGNLIRKKLNHSSCTFAVYNVLGRKKPYSIFFRTEGEQVKGYKMSIFGQPIFTVTYHFRFMGNAKDDFQLLKMEFFRAKETYSLEQAF